MYRHGEYVPVWKHLEYYQKRDESYHRLREQEKAEETRDKERGYTWTPGGGRISE